jgi:phosphoserine phosphatase RsbU/P
VMDVSGKSMQGAIISVLSSGLLYGQSGRGQGPGEVLSAINGHLHAKTNKKTFITGLLALLEPASGRLTLANAGHADPILIRDGAVLALPRPPKRDLALGAVRCWTYGEIELWLKPGDLLCLYTDGLNEAQNSQNQLFGESALVTALTQYRQMPVKELLQRILDEIADFRGKTPQSDDITLILLKAENPMDVPETE